ncbi:MAG: SDR family oxidoreductase [Clostridia bacterium]
MKVALITGGNRGIGRATVEKFASNGYIVAFTYNSNKLQAEELVKKLSFSQNIVVAYQCDVSSLASCQNVASQIINQFKHIDCVVCNAGISISKPITDYTQDDYASIMSVNARGVFNTVKAVVPYLISSKSGNIIALSSIAEQGLSCESVYAMSKGGVVSFAYSLAKELGLSNIRVNCVSPGLIDTDMNSQLTEQERQTLLDKCLIKRIGLSQDVANAIFFLSQASYITGINLAVDGGLIL